MQKIKKNSWKKKKYDYCNKIFSGRKDGKIKLRTSPRKNGNS